MMKHLLIKGNQ